MHGILALIILFSLIKNYVGALYFKLKRGSKKKLEKKFFKERRVHLVRLFWLCFYGFIRLG